MDNSILDYTRQSAALEAVRQSFIEGDPGRAAVRRVLRRPRRGPAAAHAGASKRTCARTASATTSTTPSTWPRRRASGACARPALGLSMAMKEDAKSISFVEDTAVPPERLRDYIERFLALVRAHGTTAGVYAHASVGCLHVRPGGQPEDRGGRAAVRGDRQRQRRPGARVRRRAVGRARRRPGAQPVHAQDVRAGPLRRVPRRSSRRSTRPACSTRARSSTPAP